MFGKTDGFDLSLDRQITSVFESMTETTPDAEEYKELLTHLNELMALRHNRKKPRVSSEAVLMVAGNLLGILIIVAYEQKHVMTSRAKDFILKPKT